MAKKTRSLSEVRSKVASMIERGECPSMAIAVAQEGKVIWEETFGWANKDSKIKATPNTIYPIASLSKSLTATGIMALAEQEKVNLDDPAEEYITPSKLAIYEGKTSEVTIKRILNMTSGIPHGYMVYEDQHSSPKIGKFINHYGIVVFPPGELELYSNFSYGILELIAEKVSGKNFREFMKTEVFDPLGMTQTSVGISDSHECVAIKYNSDKISIPHNYFVPAAAGGVYSSVRDLIRFGLFHLNTPLPDQKRILGEKSLMAMHMAKNHNLQSSIMALGWGSITLDDGSAWVLSNGGIEGATSMLSLVPSANLAVVCLTNSTSRSRVTDQIAIEIIDTLIPNFSKKIENFMQRYETENAFKLYTPSPQLVGSWDGWIIVQETKTPIKFVFHKNGQVYARLNKLRETTINNVSVRNDELKGDFKARLLTNGEIEAEQAISIHLKVKSNRMYGFVSVEQNASKGFLTPFYVRFDRQES